MKNPTSFEERLDNVIRLVGDVYTIMGDEYSSNADQTSIRNSISSIRDRNTVSDVLIWNYRNDKQKIKELAEYEQKLIKMVDTLKDAEWKDWNLLLWAAHHGCDSLLALCFERGWDVNNHYKEQTTPLLVALKNKHENTALQCIKQPGCDLNHVDPSKQRTALELAENGYCPNLKDTLEKAGAKRSDQTTLDLNLNTAETIISLKNELQVAQPSGWFGSFFASSSNSTGMSNNVGQGFKIDP